jgi:cytochrome c biogenesis protein CcmG/thiol:disulfide interchange protein DsbE
MARTKTVALGVVLGALALGAGGSAGGATVAAARAAEPAAAPSSAREPVLTELSGRKVTLESLRGRAVAVNFWATWCPPCRYEVPELAAFYREHQGRCFELLGVAEESGSAGEVARGAKELGIPYPVLLDPGAALARRFGISGLPHTVILDAGGRVRHVFEGAIDRRQLESALAPLLGAPGKRCDA